MLTLWTVFELSLESARAAKPAAAPQPLCLSMPARCLEAAMYPVGTDTEVSWCGEGSLWMGRHVLHICQGNVTGVYCRGNVWGLLQRQCPLSLGSTAEAMPVVTGVYCRGNVCCHWGLLQRQCLLSLGSTAEATSVSLLLCLYAHWHGNAFILHSRPQYKNTCYPRSPAVWQNQDSLITVPRPVSG